MDYGLFIVVFLTVFIIYTIYMLVDDFVVGTEKTLASISTTISVQDSRLDVMKKISNFIVNQNKYRIDYYNPQSYHIVLNQSMSLQQFGFLYSIKILDDGEKSNLVVGITGKWPIVGKWSEKKARMQLTGLVNAIRANFYSTST